MDLQTLFLCLNPQRIRPCTFLLGRAKHSHDLIAAIEKGFQHRLPKILLADNCNLHLVTALGGSVKAPASLLAAISASLQPNTSLRISPVCSPSMGDRSIFAGDAESLIGMPMLNHLPR